MKMKLLYVPMVMAVMSALVVTNSGHTAKPELGPTTTTPKPTPWTTTTGPSGLNLNGKMITLSRDRGGISFYPPYFYPWSSTPRYPTSRYTTRPYYTTTRPWTTNTRPYYTTTRPWTTRTRPYYTTTRPWTTRTRPYYTTTRPWTTRTRPYYITTRPWTTRTRPYYTTTRPWTTTAPHTIGVSVCLRYLGEVASYPSIFTLSPSSRNPLMLGISSPGGYALSFDRYGYSRLYMKPDIRFWSNTGPDIWTRVCLTVDTVKNVAQVFSGSSISIRKMLPSQYVWSGEPVIDFSGFDGQLTDIQVWDYPLRYKEIFNYMTNGFYAPYSGSVLTWSSISYTPRGNVLLEDNYESQARQPISSKRRGHRPKGAKKTRGFFNKGGRGERKTEQL